MQTTDTDQLFLTDAQLRLSDARAAKAKANDDDASSGYPIRLASKPLAVQVVGDEAFVAENGFVARRLDLVTGESRGVYRGHAGPVTSLALHKGRLFTGSWDKTVKVWDVESRRVLATLEAHSDFVNCVHVVPELDVLLTGSSDRDVRAWPLGGLGPSLPAWRSHTRPVQALASHPVPDGAVAFSADSMGCLKGWLLTAGAEPRLLWTCRPHETGIYALQVGVPDEPECGQVWTASADRSALLSAFDFSSASAPPAPLLRIVHPYYVRSLTYLPLALASATRPLSEKPWLFTGGTDEEIRLFDLSLFDVSDAKKERVVTVGSRAEGVEPVEVLSGHWHEVGGLAPWLSSSPVRLEPDAEAGSDWLVSIGLDGTVRRWDLAQIGRPRKKARPKPAGMTLSAEEEAELADLLDDV